MGHPEQAKSPRPHLQYGLTLPEARIRFSRKLTLDPKCGDLSAKKRRSTLTSAGPFRGMNTSHSGHRSGSRNHLVRCPQRGRKFAPASYSSDFLFSQDAEFTWPNAPTKNRKRINLRTMPAKRFGHYTAQLLSPELEIGFIAACNPRLKLLVVYAFRRADFPWVGNWEERHNRTAAPWRGENVFRGMRTPAPHQLPRFRDAETMDQGPLFGQTTYHCFQPNRRLKFAF